LHPGGIEASRSIADFIVREGGKAGRAPWAAFNIGALSESLPSRLRNGRFATTGKMRRLTGRLSLWITFNRGAKTPCCADDRNVELSGRGLNGSAYFFGTATVF
jgi:hypothetical protein